MAKLEIKKYPGRVLRKKAKEVEKFDEEIKKISAEMAETLKENGGAGLAAPQVGVSKRIIAVLVDENKIEIFINPKITKKSREKKTAEEGCLSFPGIFLKIKRPSKVVIQAIDLERRMLEVEVEGILSRVFQHEIDHLNGILFIDRAGFWQRWKARKKIAGRA